MPKRIEIGRVMGRRGNRGALTVRIHPDDAPLWDGLERVILRLGKREEPFEVESARAYGDKWILKLAGLDEIGAAQEFRGALVECDDDQLPEPDAGEVLIHRLVGLEVFEQDEKLGEVAQVLPTGGVDLLEVRRPDGGELLIPLAQEILVEIQEEDGRIFVRLPEGLRELNREDEP